MRLVQDDERRPLPEPRRRRRGNRLETPRTVPVEQRDPCQADIEHRAREIAVDRHRVRSPKHVPGLILATPPRPAPTPSPAQPRSACPSRRTHHTASGPRAQPTRPPPRTATCPNPAPHANTHADARTGPRRRPRYQLVQQLGLLGVQQERLTRQRTIGNRQMRRDPLPHRGTDRTEIAPRGPTRGSGWRRRGAL